MPMLKERKSLLIKNLTGVLLILTICCLPQGLLFLTLCTKQDRNIPPNAEVLVSACKKPMVRGIPGGEVLFVHEGLTNKMYLLDLRTGEKRKVLKDQVLYNEERVVFLSPELVWLIGSVNGPEYSNYRPHYILDLTDGQRYELLDLGLLPRLENRKFNPDNYSYIRSADRVFIDLSRNKLIALSTDFRTNQNGRVVLNGYTHNEDEFLLKLAKDLGMDYENVDLSLRSKRSNTPSPTGKYVVREDGIYLSMINTRLPLPPSPYSFRSWYYDDSGVIVHNKYGTYWIITQFFGDYYHLSYPVLKLRLPVQ